MSLIKKIKFPNETIYDIGSKWSNIDKENIVYEPSEIVSFENNKIEPLKKCIINIKAIQEGSGDPSPENVRLITGWTGATVQRTGKNLCPDSMVQLGGGSPRTYSIQFSCRLPAGAYVWSAETENEDKASYGVTFYHRPSSGAAVRVGQVNLTTGQVVLDGYADFVYVYMNQTDFDGGKTVGFDRIQIEAGTEATAYEPYQGDTYSISFPAEAGTVYGGTLDVLTGVLTVDRVCKTLIGTDIQARGSNVTSAGDYRFYSTADASQDILLPLDAQTAADVLCSVAVAIPHGDSSLYGVSVNRLDSRIYLHIQECGQMTLEEFRTWMDNHNVQVAYKIITPIIYQLSPQIIFTLLGNNNIWADCGDISIELENFYSDIQNEFTLNLLENRLLFNLNNNLITSNHYISNNQLAINSNTPATTALYINGSTLTNGNITIKNDNDWSATGSSNEPAFIMEGADNKYFKFRFSRYGKNVDIGWDWDAMDGAGIAVRGATADDIPGQFVLFARKPNTTTSTIADTSQLLGSPDGLLRWKKSSGDSNPRLAINANSSNHTLYVNGTTYLKGDTKISANTSTIGCTLQYNDSLDTLNFVFD